MRALPLAVVSHQWRPPVLHLATGKHDLFRLGARLFDMPRRPLPSPLFALIIGINKYQNVWHSETNPEGYIPLGAAVPDANMVEDFFIQMGVPPGNIVSLRDEEATRENIIKELQALKDNGEIKKNEASILIYFAGHGSRIAIPPEWVGWHATDGMIEMICPVDIGMAIPGSKKKVEGIPDRTVAAILNQLSMAKGDNIVSSSVLEYVTVLSQDSIAPTPQTVILDCCCSAGATRDQVSSGLVKRSIPKPPALSSDCDFPIWGHDSRRHGFRSTGVARWFSGQSNESHVLLAACGRDQLALENGSNGCFTAAVFEVLRNIPIDQLTYTSLMDKLKIPNNLFVSHLLRPGVHRT